MRWAALFFLLSVVPVRGELASDFQGVGKTIAALNEARATKDGRDLAGLLAADIEPEERARFLEFEARLTAESRRPLSEVRMPFAEVERVMFLTADIALVDVRNSQGAGEMLILKLVGRRWVIAAMRSAEPPKLF